MFKPRYTAPTKDLLCYSGKPLGVSPCVYGNPQAWQYSSLSNCVGYVWGRVYEILVSVGREDIAKTLQNPPNAKSFWAKFMPSWERGQEARVGAIAVWDTGANRAGHVAIVEAVDNEVVVSASDYGGSKFYNKRLKKDMKWGTAKYLGCIYLPVSLEPTYPTPVKRDKNVHQVKVNVSNLRLRETPNGAIYARYCAEGVYNVLSEEYAGNYLWYKIADDFWIAFNDSWENDYPTAESEVEKLSKELNRAILRIDALEKINAHLSEKIQAVKEVLEDE